MAGNAFHAAEPADQSGISRAQGAVFIGILLALILKTTLDTFFEGIADHNTLGAVLAVMNKQLAKSVLLVCQLIVFLFALIRFYWGSFRYYQQKPKVEETPEVAVDLLGALLLFMSFYVVSLLIRTTSLFYYGLILVNGVDLAWFLLATTHLALQEGMRKVAGWYILFDVLTVVAVGLTTGADAIWGPTRFFVFQFLALFAVLAIGVWDLIKLWSYYKNAPDWQDKLR
jgi:hypothetical protein